MSTTPSCADHVRSCEQARRSSFLTTTVVLLASAAPVLAQSGTPAGGSSEADRTVWLAAAFLASGVFAIIGGLAAPDWFINSPRAALFLKLLGRNGTRVFYVILGMAILSMGVVLLVADSSAS